MQVLYGMGDKLAKLWLKRVIGCGYIALRRTAARDGLPDSTPAGKHASSFLRQSLEERPVEECFPVVGKGEQGSREQGSRGGEGEYFILL